MIIVVSKRIISKREEEDPVREVESTTDNDLGEEMFSKVHIKKCRWRGRLYSRATFSQSNT